MASGRPPGNIQEHQIELDSHTDQCCVGMNAHVLYDWPGCTVTVTSFLESLGHVKNTKTVSAVIADDHPESGMPYLLVIHQALYFPELKHNLLCPMQLWYSGIILDETLKHLAVAPTRAHHSLTVDDLSISLDLKGMTSYFPSRMPTAEELEDYPLRAYDLTSEAPHWDPKSDCYSEHTARMVDTDGNIIPHPPCDARQLFGLTYQQLTDPFQPVCQISVTQVHSPNPKRTVEDLAHTWGIGPKLAKQTLKVTTQHGLHTWGGHSISHHYLTGDRPMQYHCLNTALYHNTLFLLVKSRHGNHCLEIYCSDYGWSCNFPIKKESQVHNTLDELFHRFGVLE